MSLDKEIETARQTIVSDGYDMSVGEVMSLYRDAEISINPEFQRLFRWDLTRKSRFIESLLLGIPIPPIFVYQDEEGVWELIDGLQRLSTILEFTGELRSPDNSRAEASILNGTRLLPSLEGKGWKKSTDPCAEYDGIGKIHQLQIKRARIRVEILKYESDLNAKFELFQRLNTGGEILSPQEVRSCIAFMINKCVFKWLKRHAEDSNFLSTIDQTKRALEKQSAVELVLRFVAFRAVEYDGRSDVHEYLDNSLRQLADDKSFDWEQESSIFSRTFELLNNVQGRMAFKRWDGDAFTGKFLMSVFEVVGIGVAMHIDEIERMPDASRFIINKSKSLWNLDEFQRNSGAGIRGTTRLSALVPLAREFFQP